MPSTIRMPSRNSADTEASDAAARLSKGERTRLAILDAALDVIRSAGFAGASQDAIARQAGISQSTLRHHFPTADELHIETFRSQYRSNRSEMEAIVLRPWSDPIEMVLAMVTAHLDHIVSGSDTLVFESLAFLSRRTDVKAVRDGWLQWLAAHYATAIAKLHSELSDEECKLRGFEIITVTMGAWITAGHSHPQLTGATRAQLTARLLALVFEIIRR